MHNTDVECTYLRAYRYSLMFSRLLLLIQYESEATTKVK